MSLSNNFDFAPVEIGLMTKHAIAGDNWLECNGETFNESDYPELYENLSILKEYSITNEMKTDVYDKWTERYINGKKVRIGSSALYIKPASKNSTERKIKILEYNNDTQTWEDKFEQEILSTLIPNPYNSSSIINTDWKYGIPYADLFYANGYYLLNVVVGYYSSNNNRWYSIYFIGTDLNSLRYKGWIGSGEGYYDYLNNCVGFEYRNNKWSIIIISRYSEDMTFYVYEVNETDLSSNVIWGSTYNSSSESYTHTYPTKGYNYRDIPYDNQINGTVYYLPSTGKYNYIWFKTSNDYKNLYSTYKYKSSNTEYYGATNVAYDNYGSQPYENYGCYCNNYFPIYYGEEVYLLAGGGLSNEKILIRPYYDASTTRFEFINISNIVKKGSSVYGCRIDGDEIILFIGNVMKRKEEKIDGFNRGQIIKMPLEDFLENNSSRIKVLRTYNYIDFYSSQINTVYTSNGTTKLYIVRGGGYTITEDLELVYQGGGECVSVSSGTNSFTTHDVGVKEEKGLLPDKEGLYIKAR